MERAESVVALNDVLPDPSEQIVRLQEAVAPVAVSQPKEAQRPEKSAALQKTETLRETAAVQETETVQEPEIVQKPEAVQEPESLPNPFPNLIHAHIAALIGYLGGHD